MFWKHRQKFREAQNALESNEYSRAELLLSELLEKDSEAIEALLHRALVRLRMGKADLALADSQKVVELRPESGVGFMVRGEVQLSLGLYQEAYESFQKACRLERDNGRAYYGWARACLGLKKKEEASDYMEIALQFERDYVYAQVFSEMLFSIQQA